MAYEEFPNGIRYGVTNPATINYPVRFTIPYQTGMRSDFADIRFASLDLQTAYPYWVESQTDAVSVVVRVLVPANVTEFYLRWGKSDAVSESDGEAVFGFFDDFNGDSLDTEKWTPVINNGISVTGGALQISSGATNFAKIRSNVQINPNVTIVMKIASSTYFTSIALGSSDYTGNGSSIGLEHYSSSYESAIYTGPALDAGTGVGISWYPPRTGGSLYTQGDVIPEPPSGYYILEFAIPQGNKLKCRYNGGNWTTSTQYDGINSPEFIEILHYRNFAAMYLDYIAVCPYIATEPTVSAIETMGPIFPRAFKYAVLNPATIPYPGRFTVPYRYAMNTDFSDLRFIAVDGTALPYWIESKTDGVEATVRVLLPPNEVEFFMRWGNPYAVSESDGEAVFPDFFDDFEGDTLDEEKWTVQSGVTVTVANSNVRLQNTNTEPCKGILSNQTFNVQNYIAEWYVTEYEYNGGYGGLFAGGASITNGYAIGQPEISGVHQYCGTGTNCIALTSGTIYDAISANAHYKTYFSGTNLLTYRNDELKYTWNCSGYITSTAVPMCPSVNKASPAKYDWVAVYPYLATEPTVTAFDPFDGCVAYYPFNGNANDVIGGHNGTVTGATLTDVNGDADKAYLFASGDTITWDNIDNFGTALFWSNDGDGVWVFNIANTYVSATGISGFTGKIGEVWIFDSVLTIGSDKVAALYDLTKYQYQTEASTATGLMDGCVAYWPMHGDAQDIVGSHDGIITNAILANGKFGEINGAYYFNGTDSNISIPNPNDFNKSAFSISMWVKNEEQINTRGCLFGNKTSKNYYGYDLRQYNSSTYGGDFRLNFNNPTGGGTTACHYADGLPLGVWTHVVVTYESDGNSSMYINGECVDTKSAPKSYYTSSNYVFIGKNSIRSGYYDLYKGTIENMMFIDHALTDNEVKSIYDITKYRYINVKDKNYESLFSGCVAYWPMHGNAQDVIGSHDGTVTGATLTDGRFGEANGAYDFNPTQYITPATPADFKSSVFTWSMWVKIDTTSPDVDDSGGRIVGFRNSSGYYGYHFHAQYSQGWKLRYWIGGTNTGGAYNYVGNAALPSNEWFLLTIVQSESELKFYINGVVDATFSVASSVYKWDTTMIAYIGRATPTTTAYCMEYGQIGDTMFFNISKSPEEVKALYDLTKEKYVYPLIGGERR